MPLLDTNVHGEPVMFEFDYDDNDKEIVTPLPWKWVICHNCDGHGKHMTESIRQHAYSREDFDEDPDFAEAYFNGGYDVTCETCRGTGKVKDIDEDAIPAALKSRYEAAAEATREAAYERSQENRLRNMGVEF